MLLLIIGGKINEVERLKNSVLISASNALIDVETQEISEKMTFVYSQNKYREGESHTFILLIISKTA